MVRGTIDSRQFMRGTDPIKSTWECPIFYFCIKQTSINFSLISLFNKTLHYAITH